MTTVNLDHDTLSIEMDGTDKLWSLRSRLSIPAEHVVGAERADTEAREWLHGLRLGGTHLPGVISAGTFRSHGRWVFWNVHDPDKAIGIDLRDERYDRLVLEVADPVQTVERLRGAAGAGAPDPAAPTSVRAARGRGLVAAIVAAALAAVVLGLVMPRGPVTSGQALMTMLAGVLVGGAAGFAMRSRWAMLVAPVTFVAVFELVRAGQVGPTVDGIHLSSVYGILAFATGRLLHGVLLFGPMLVGVSLGRAAAGRWGPGAGSLALPRHRVWLIARRGILALATVALLALAVLIARPASTDPILGPDGNVLAGSVAELTRVEVGGHDQAIMIRGASTENPVLLVLAGGPGGSEIGSVRNFSEALERDFVVATWDQRGTGKSAGEIAPTSTMTVEQMVSDALEVTNYLRKRFDERKIYVVGNSWGTILGVLAAQQHPELYHAFIGSGQMVSPVDTDRMFYEDTLAWARRTGDAALVETLRTNGPPPYDDLWQYETALSHEHDWNPYPGMEEFQEKGEMPGNIFVEEYDLMEKLHTLPGFMDTFSVLYPQLHGIDFREQAASLEIPGLPRPRRP